MQIHIYYEPAMNYQWCRLIQRFFKFFRYRSQYDGFDIVVNDCYAHNGATKKIQLIDHYGYVGEMQVLLVLLSGEGGIEANDGSTS